MAKTFQAPALELVDPRTLTPHPRNPRQGDIGAIVESIRATGWHGVIVGQKSTGFIIAGWHRGRAAAFIIDAIGRAEEDWQEWAGAHADDPVAHGVVPIEWQDLDDDAAIRKLLADNRTNDLAAYDDQALADLLTELAQSDHEFSGTGWDGDDLDSILVDIAEGVDFGDDADDKADEIPDAPEPSEVVTRAGDVWELGRHRLLCGDCRNADDVMRLLDGATINVAITSPPYADRREYDDESGFLPVPPDEYVEWFAPAAENIAAHIADDGSWFLNIKPGAEGLDTPLYVMDLVIAHVREWGWHFATEFCWERTGVPKHVTTRFKNQFEPIYQFVRGEWKMRPDAVRHWSSSVPQARGGDGALAGQSMGLSEYQGGKKGQGYVGNMTRAQGDPERVPFLGEEIREGLAYPGNRLPTFSGSHEALGHSAAFPVGLPSFFVRAYTDESDNVYDPFVGSGSTIIAAERDGRTGYGVELSPAYCDIVCKRFQAFTGTKPTRNGEAVDFTPDVPRETDAAIDSESG